MTKIYCADVECLFNNDKCVCTAKEVALSWHSVVTVWEGRQEFHRCKMRETRKERREPEKLMEVFINGQTGKV